MVCVATLKGKEVCGWVRVVVVGCKMRRRGWKEKKNGEIGRESWEKK